MMLSKKIIKLWKYKWVLRSIFKTVFFNFHYLPFKQAIKLPIFLYKPRFKNLKGSIVIDTNKIKPGMILLGYDSVSVYPNSGIIIDNNGGKIIFKGETTIGNNSAISIGKNAILCLGERFTGSTTLKIICYYKITFGTDVRIGWNNTFMDTDLHSMIKIATNTHTKGYGQIKIGDNNWFGMNCVIMKNTVTPDFCTIAGTSLLNKDYSEFPKYTIIGSDKHISILRTGVYRDWRNDKINYNN